MWNTSFNFLNDSFGVAKLDFDKGQCYTLKFIGHDFGVTCQNYPKITRFVFYLLSKVLSYFYIYLFTYLLIYGVCVCVYVCVLVCVVRACLGR